MFNFELQNNDDSRFNLKEYTGNNRLLVIFFRGAWCNYCKKQLKEIQNSLFEFDKLNIRIIALSCDSKLNSSLLKEFLKLEYPVLSDSAFKIIDYFEFRTKHKGKDVSKPAILLFNPEGKEIFRHVGVDYDDRIGTEKLIDIISKITA